MTSLLLSTSMAKRIKKSKIFQVEIRENSRSLLQFWESLRSWFLMSRLLGLILFQEFMFGMCFLNSKINTRPPSFSPLIIWMKPRNLPIEYVSSKKEISLWRALPSKSKTNMEKAIIWESTISLTLDKKKIKFFIKLKNKRKL